MRIDWRSRFNLKQCSPIAVSLLLFLSTADAGTAPALGQEPPYMTQVREHINKGNGLLGRRLFAEAIGEYQKALDLDASNVAARHNIAETHNNWGIYWYGMRKYNDAMREWEITLELEPNHFNAKRNLVLLKQFAARQGIKLGQPAPENSAGTDEPGSSGPGGAGSSGPGSAGTSGSGASLRGGFAGNNNAPPRSGMQGGKEDTTEPSAVMILTPNVKVGTGASSSSEDAGTSKPTAGANSGTGGGATGSGSSATAAPVSTTSGRSASAVPQVDPNGGPDDFEVAQPPVQEEEKPPPSKSKNKKKQKVAASETKSTENTGNDTNSASQQPSKTAIPDNLHSSSASNKWAPAVTKSAGGEEPTIEDELKLLENKVYGQVQDLPVLKRLEKLEKDTSGKVSSGPIRERILNLRQHYGI